MQTEGRTCAQTERTGLESRAEVKEGAVAQGDPPWLWCSAGGPSGVFVFRAGGQRQAAPLSSTGRVSAHPT